MWNSGLTVVVKLVVIVVVVIVIVIVVCVCMYVCLSVYVLITQENETIYFNFLYFFLIILKTIRDIRKIITPSNSPN